MLKIVINHVDVDELTTILAKYVQSNLAMSWCFA